MISSPLLIVASVLFVISVNACNKPTESSAVVTLEYEITPQPVIIGSSTLQLSLADSSRQPVRGASITVEANMSHGGMAPVVAQTIETAPGRYQTILNLTMAGDWIFLTHITLASGQKLERQLDVKGVLPR